MSFLGTIRKKTKQTFFLSVLLMLVSGALLGASFSFIQVKSKEVTSLVSQITQEQIEEANFQSVRELFQNTTSEREELSEYFVTEDEIVSFIEIIESLGELVGINLELKDVGIKGTTNPYLELKFSTQGTWRDTIHLLALLEAYPARLDVTNFNTRKDEGENSPESWNTDFTIHVLSFIKK